MMLCFLVRDKSILDFGIGFLLMLLAGDRAARRRDHA